MPGPVMRADEPGEASRLKHYALEIVAQLPLDKSEALRVLTYARELVEWQDEAPKADVIQLVAGA